MERIRTENWFGGEGGDGEGERDMRTGADTEASWLGADTEGHDRLQNQLRLAFNIPFTPTRGRAFVACAGFCRVFVNGVWVSRGSLHYGASQV